MGNFDVVFDPQHCPVAIGAEFEARTARSERPSSAGTDLLGWYSSDLRCWAAGRPPPGVDRERAIVIGYFVSGEPIHRCVAAAPMVGTTGDIEALSLWSRTERCARQAATTSSGDRGQDRLRLVTEAGMRLASMTL